jgi:predicted O-linked N-acetylglucosamine transferase (SPINDLY family)
MSPLAELHMTPAVEIPALRGPEVPERERLFVSVMQHVSRHDWFGAIAASEALFAIVDPPPKEMLLNYATCLMNVGRAREAAEAYERCIPLLPEHAMVLTENVIFCRDHCDETTAAEAYQRRRDFWTKYLEPITRATDIFHDNDRDPERPLRVGYVSGDFRSHSANMAFGFVVLRHSPAVKVFCYSSHPPAGWDEFTTVYTQETTFRVIYGLSPAETAKMMRRDQIDILVDLTGFSDGSRLAVFALKPAPIQVHAWGYVLGTGMDTMDVILGDEYAMPYADQPYYRERIVHLPSIVPFCGQIYAPPVSLLPCLQASGPYPFTFGVFNRAAKVGEVALSAWSQILKATTDTRIIFKEAQVCQPYHRERILKALDVNPDRVIFQGQTAHGQHLQAFDQIDLLLDPHPISGGVSTLESLWQGVPVLVRRPDQPRVASAVGYSGLKVLGMEDFIANTAEDYVRLGVRWSLEGRQQLAQWRIQLRKRVFNSVLVQNYPTRVEDVYRDLWKEWIHKQGA